MKVAIDINVVMDVLAQRSPHVQLSERVLNLIEYRGDEGYLAGTAYTTIFYLTRQTFDASEAHRLVGDLLATYDIAPIDRDVLKSAHTLDWDDFEDAVLHEATRTVGCTALVTRNEADFTDASLEIYSPGDFLIEFMPDELLSDSDDG